jgi:hypothetical protein
MKGLMAGKDRFFYISFELRSDRTRPIQVMEPNRIAR